MKKKQKNKSASKKNQRIENFWHHVTFNIHASTFVRLFVCSFFDNESCLFDFCTTRKYSCSVEHDHMLSAQRLKFATDVTVLRVHNELFTDTFPSSMTQNILFHLSM